MTGLPGWLVAHLTATGRHNADAKICDNESEVGRSANSDRPLTRLLDSDERGLVVESIRDPSRVPCLCGCGGFPTRARDYLRGHRPQPTLLDALNRHVIRNLSGCWGWTGPVNKKGYGVVRIPGRRYLAHRAMWIVVNGPLSSADCVLHRCDNPPCSNPADLFLGDKATNNADMIAKGRMPRGERRTQSKLTAAAVRQIRERYEAGEFQQPLADAFGVAQITISQIVRRETWRHIP